MTLMHSIQSAQQKGEGAWRKRTVVKQEKCESSDKMMTGVNGANSILNFGEALVKSVKNQPLEILKKETLTEELSSPFPQELSRRVAGWELSNTRPQSTRQF